MRKAFKELAVGDVFRSYKDNNRYVKITHEKISCCKYFNAALFDDRNNKVGFQQDESVEAEVNDNQ